MKRTNRLNNRVRITIKPFTKGKDSDYIDNCINDGYIPPGYYDVGCPHIIYFKRIKRR